MVRPLLTLAYVLSAAAGLILVLKVWAVFEIPDVLGEESEMQYRLDGIALALKDAAIVAALAGAMFALDRWLDRGAPRA